MFTRNFYAKYHAFLAQTVLSGALTDITGATKDCGYYGGVEVTRYLPYFANLDFSTTSGYVVGSGTKPATLDDYKLESRIMSGLNSICSVAPDENNNPCCVYTITNVSDGPITIGEIGIYSTGYTRIGNSSPCTILIERTVLETPITIEPGGVGQITYTIRMNYPE